MAEIERRPDETRAAYAALLDYAAMGVGGGRRSLRDLLSEYVRRSSDDRLTEKPPTTKWGTLSTWSTRYDWQLRVTAYDEALADATRVAREEALAEKQRAWIERHMGPEETLALMSDNARGSPRDFLLRNDKGEFTGFDLSDDKPLERIKEITLTTRQIGELTTEKTTKIKLYDAHAALVKLGEHHKLWGKSDDILKYIDLSKLDADQLERLSNGEDPVAVLISKPDPTPSAG